MSPFCDTSATCVDTIVALQGLVNREDRASRGFRHGLVDSRGPSPDAGLPGSPWCTAGIERAEKRWSHNQAGKREPKARSQHRSSVCRNLSLLDFCCRRLGLAVSRGAAGAASEPGNFAKPELRFRLQ